MTARLACLLLLLGFVSDAVAEDESSIQCGRVPPALWCANKDVAERCGFTASCSRFEQQSAGKKLQITLLFESLCPDCQDFIENALFTDVYAHFSKWVDIELVAYGNARRLPNGSFECQHGAAECEANQHETCAIHFLPDPVPYIHCLEVKIRLGESLADASTACATKTRVSHVQYDQILHCVKTPTGAALQLEAAKRTESAYPDKHTHVPWLYFNNVSLANSQFLIRDLSVFICESLATDHQPDVCAGLGQRKWGAARCAKPQQPEFFV